MPTTCNLITLPNGRAICMSPILPLQFLHNNTITALFIHINKSHEKIERHFCLLLLSKRSHSKESVSLAPVSFSSTPSCQQPYQKLGSSNVLYIKAEACFQTRQHRGTLGNEADSHTGNTARCAHKQRGSCSSRCRDTSDRRAQSGARICSTRCYIAFFLSCYENLDNENEHLFWNFFHMKTSKGFVVLFFLHIPYYIHTLCASILLS